MGITPPFIDFLFRSLYLSHPVIQASIDVLSAAGDCGPLSGPVVASLAD